MLAAGLAEALSAIHGAGVVHRDLKSANVLLADDGPRVIDFGISRAAEASSLTHTGLVVGSPGFMSPEQAEGLETGPSSDIFSLAAVLTFAATGRGPFGGGSTPAQVYRVVHDAPELDLVPAEIRPLIARCLAKDPAGRPTAADLLAGAAYPAQDWSRQAGDAHVPPRQGTAGTDTRRGAAGTDTRRGAAGPDLGRAGRGGGLAASAGWGASAELAASAGWGASASWPHPRAWLRPRFPRRCPAVPRSGTAPYPAAPGSAAGRDGHHGEPRRRPFAVAAVLAALIGGGGGAAFALTGAPAHTAPSARQVAGAAPPAAAAPTSRAPDAAAASSSPASAAAGTRSSATPPAYAPPASTTPTYVPRSTQSASPSVPPASAPPSSLRPSSPPPSTAPSPVTSPSPGTSSGTPPHVLPRRRPAGGGQRDLRALAVRLASACSPAGVPGDGALEGSR